MEREHLIEFTQVVVKKASTSEHMLNRVMPRDNIALCAVLRIKENVYNNRWFYLFIDFLIQMMICVQDG